MQMLLPSLKLPVPADRHYIDRGRCFRARIGNHPKNQGTTLSTFSAMKYDGVGNRLSMTANIPQNGRAPDASRTVAYQYDRLDQLMSEQSAVFPGNTDSYREGYNYSFSDDNAGNHQIFRSVGVTPHNNADNQLTKAGFGYDGKGNPTTYFGIASVKYDAESRLSNLPGKVQAGYDGDGLRAWKATPGPDGPTQPVYFLYDGDKAVVEEDANGAVLAWNGYGADGLKLRMVGSGSHDYYYAYDPQGSVANRIDPLHGDADTAVYDAYGNLQAEINATTGMAETAIDPVGYSGQNGCYTDPETGLVLMTHRFYDPTQGRWLNRDPIGYKGGINLCAYCGNNPVSHADPSGLDRDDAVKALRQFRPDIIHVADAYGIQPQLLAGVVWVEVYAGGKSGWNFWNRALSIDKFVLVGHASLGMTQMTKTTADIPGYASIPTWDAAQATFDYAAKYDADIHQQLVDSATMLQRLASRSNRYRTRYGQLTPWEMSIILTEYNKGPTRSPASRAQPSEHYGKRFLNAYDTIQGILSGRY